MSFYLFTNSTTEHDKDTNYEQDQQGSTSANSGPYIQRHIN